MSAADEAKILAEIQGSQESEQKLRKQRDSELIGTIRQSLADGSQKLAELLSADPIQLAAVQKSLGESIDALDALGCGIRILKS